MTWLTTLVTGTVIFFLSLFSGVAGLFHSASTPTIAPVVVATTTGSFAPTAIGILTPSAVNQQDFATSTKRYTVQNNTVYFIFGSDKQEKVIADADPSTFSVICTSGSDGLSYAKDNSSVYLNDKKVMGANPQTFTLLSKFDYSGWYGCPKYAEDANRVYQDGVKISDYPNSFTTLGVSHASSRQLLTDGRSIFYMFGILSTDASHFELIQYPQAKLLYAKDSHTFYAASPQSGDIDPIKNSDPASFHFIGDASASLYAFDKNLLYYFGGYGITSQSITSVGLDLNTLTSSPSSSGGFSACSIKDKNHVYVQGYNLVPGADPATFVITDVACQHGKDANHQYNLNDYVPQDIG
jgi:hypothetical protein